MRFTEQNTRGMELCTGFIIVKFYDMYEVLNRCVFKLVLNLSLCIYVSNGFRQAIIQGPHTKMIFPRMILSLFEGHKIKTFCSSVGFFLVYTV